MTHDAMTERVILAFVEFVTMMKKQGADRKTVEATI